MMQYYHTKYYTCPPLWIWWWVLLMTSYECVVPLCCVILWVGVVVMGVDSLWGILRQ